MARSKLRLDLKPLSATSISFPEDGSRMPRGGMDPTPQWWVTETAGRCGPKGWEFGSRGALDAHLAARGLRPEQIDELWAQQEIRIEDDQAVAAPMWQRDPLDHHAG